MEHSFEIFSVNSISEGKDTLGDVTVKLSAEGKSYSGRGLSTDIIKASIVAYLQAANKLMRHYESKKEA